MLENVPGLGRCDDNEGNTHAHGPALDGPGHFYSIEMSDP